MKAIETTGHLRKKRTLELDRDITVRGKRKIKVILLIPEEDEIDESEWLKSLSNNPSFQFLSEPEEDIYTTKDGKPVKR